MPTDAPTTTVGSSAAPIAIDRVERPPREFLTGKTLIELVENSPRTYAIEGVPHGATDPQATLAELYPQRLPALDLPQVVELDGRRVIRPWKTTGEAQAILDKAEVFYARGEYAEAKRIAQEALHVEPDYYWTWLYLGDCEHFSNNPEAALQNYRKAAELNPYDPRVHFFQASALVRLGRLAEARKGFARSLALSPRRPGLVERLRKDPNLDFTVVELFLPRVELEQKSEQEIAVRTEPDAHHWLAYGLCKAAWMMEPEHRGTAQHVFTTTEERECLGLVATAYSAAREAQRVSEDEGLEIVVRAANDGHLAKLVVYELASRVAPQITLTLTDAELEELVEFVDRYLLIPK